MGDCSFRAGRHAFAAIAGLFLLTWEATLARAFAVVTASDFEVLETVGAGGVGQYAVINNSTNEFIYAFAVTNPLTSSVEDSTTDKGWIAGKTPLFSNPRPVSTMRRSRAH
jgi:hypothetical protein